MEKCQLCKEDVKSVYYNMEYKVSGHKRCIMNPKSFTLGIIDDQYPQHKCCDMCEAETRCTCICEKESK